MRAVDCVCRSLSRRPPVVESLHRGFESLHLSAIVPLTLTTVHRVHTLVENMEMSWSFKTVMTRPSKVIEKN